jgi:SNF1-activating kinase 1
MLNGRTAEGEELASTGSAGLVRDDADNTPRSEVPVSIQVMGTTGVNNDAAQQQNAAATRDYFTTHPAAAPPPAPSELHSLPALARTPSAVSAPTAPSASEVTVSGEMQKPDTTSSLLSPGDHRPAAHSQPSSLSVLSSDSNVTITAQDIAPTLPTSAPRRPAFPNQSYAALQNQHYPVRQHAPPVLRQRSSHPGQIHTFSSAFASLHQSGTKTVGHSPAVTPGTGLFTPQTAPPPVEDYESPETPGTYASPFLHFTHRVPPKETHVADVDVDPISGRKLINHYEVVDELGRGTHGKVKLARDLQTEGTHVAIKIVERYSKRRKLGKIVSAAEDKVKKEVAILKKARHPNIVALLEVIDDPTRKKVYIVLEWVERGEIRWRTKTRKEIAMVEARRYERERSGRQDAIAIEEDNAVLYEARKRLDKEKRREIRHHRRSLRRMAREQSDDPEVWSHELGGDEWSEESEEDRLSRISTATTVESASNKLFAQEGRRGSRAPSPLPVLPDVTTPRAETPSQFLPLTSESQVSSPVESNSASATFVPTGLEGTMYGAYAMSSGQPSRVNSLEGSMHEDTQPTPEMSRLANEILDSDLNPELEYVPVMTVQQARVAFRDTLLGLQYLHYQGIVHRDIKPPNLLATHEHRVKISDFGVSYLGRPIREDDPGEEVSEHEAQDFDEAKELAKTVGTPAFFAPELCITESTDDPLPVTKSIDVWALGITLFCMLFARTPFVDNEFIVMRQIADEEIYIPRKRLLPVNERPGSRPPSHGRNFPPVPAGRRAALDIEYEPVDDTLHDLLKRLLTKDPRKRITLEEVRHHPWVVADLPNKVKWLEETDPARQSLGKKIEISNEDVKTAVVPLQFLDRVRSGIKKVGERLGFGTLKPTNGGRGRTHSNAGLGSGSAGSPVPSAGSSSSTLNQDQRRQSLRGDEQIFAALTANRHGEHPLSRSVAASPELERSDEKFFDKDYDQESDVEKEDVEHSQHPTPSRPSPPERSKTIMSTAGSARTLKQSDIGRGRESPPRSPGLPGIPVALDSPGGQGLTAILGSGPARRAFKSLRERSMPRGTDARARSSDRASIASVDAHGEPSLAVSNTVAAGQVNPPEALQDMASGGSIPSSLQVSPAGSRAHSVVSSPHDRLYPTTVVPGILSRNSSGGSIRSIGRLMEVQAQNTEVTRSPSRQQYQPPESTAKEWQSADDERVRKLIREKREEMERPNSAFDDRTCPPSPDDHRLKRGAESSQPPSLDISTPTSHETSPTGQITQLPPAMVSSSSDFGSAVSMSVSNPSIPSVISEASSVDPTDGMPIEELEQKRNESSGDTLNGSRKLRDELVDDGYAPDQEQPLDSDNEEDYESSSDSDGGLVMSRRKSKGSSNPDMNHGHGGLADGTGLKERRGTGLSARSKKSSRSGSNNTMKKVPVRTLDSKDEESRRASLDVPREEP